MGASDGAVGKKETEIHINKEIFGIVWDLVLYEQRNVEFKSLIEF